MAVDGFGRPSSFTQEIADVICERISNGESLRSITRDEGMPDNSTVIRWLLKDEYLDFRAQYAHARERQADTIFDECLEIADDARNDFMVRTIGGKDVRVVDNEVVQRSRLRVDTRKWMAGKLRPKKYGEKVENTHSGPDGGPIETEQRTIIILPGNGREGG